MIRPKSVEVYPNYFCPKCGSKNTESLEYVNKVGKILCSCNHVIVLDKIKTFNIKAIYEETRKNNNNNKPKQSVKQKPKKIKIKSSDLSEWHKNNDMGFESELPDLDYEFDFGLPDIPNSHPKIRTFNISKEHEKDCIEALVSLGWTKRKAKSILKIAVETWCKENQTWIRDENLDSFVSYLLSNKR